MTHKGMMGLEGQEEIFKGGIMVYGHYITDTVGNERFFIEGCNYCRMSAGRQHEPNCPCRDIKVSDKPARILNYAELEFLNDKGTLIVGKNT